MSSAAPEAPAAAWRSRIVGSAEVAPQELLANPANWRTHPPAQRAALRGSLETVGWVQQVLVNRQTGFVVDGHARLEEAIARGAATVPVLYVDLDPAEEALVLAALDPIGAMATADESKLRELLSGLTVEDEGLRALLAELGTGLRRPGRTDPDDAPPVPDTPYVAAGELWALGEHRLLIGDARSAEDVARVVGGGLIDMLWTDPPYGVGYVGGTANALTIANDRLTPDGTRELVEAALRLVPLRPGGVFYIASPAGPLCLEFLRAIRDSKVHPTMKPVDLVARSIEYSSAPGETVMDPFAGSGTTIIAAEQLGRRAIALELDPAYAQVIIERWQAFTGRTAERLRG